MKSEIKQLQKIYTEAVTFTSRDPELDEENHTEDYVIEQAIKQASVKLANLIDAQEIEKGNILSLDKTLELGKKAALGSHRHVVEEEIIKFLQRREGIFPWRTMDPREVIERFREAY